MEQALGPWVAPLLMIPGMALLAISTVNRYAQLLVYAAGNPEDPRLQKQLPLLRYTLVALYTGIGADALAALLGGLLSSSEQGAFPFSQSRSQKREVRICHTFQQVPPSSFVVGP